MDCRSKHLALPFLGADFGHRHTNPKRQRGPSPALRISVAPRNGRAKHFHPELVKKRGLAPPPYAQNRENHDVPRCPSPFFHKLPAWIIGLACITLLRPSGGVAVQGEGPSFPSEDGRSEAEAGSAPPAGSACIRNEAEPRRQLVPKRSLEPRENELRRGENGTVPFGRDAARWADQDRVGPFVCRSEFPLAEVGPVLGDLVQLQTDLFEQLGVPRAREPIEIYLFGDKAAYVACIAARFPQVPYRRALFVKTDGVGRVFAFRGPTLGIDVLHESTHAFLHAALTKVPLWLDEGLAGYFEFRPTPRANGSPHQREPRWPSILQSLPTLEDLERKESLAQMGHNEYTAAWAWVHFMLHGPSEAREELVHYLADLATAKALEPLSRRLRERLPDLDGRFAAHCREESRDRTP